MDERRYVGEDDRPQRKKDQPSPCLVQKKMATSEEIANRLDNVAHELVNLVGQLSARLECVSDLRPEPEVTTKSVSESAEYFPPLFDALNNSIGLCQDVRTELQRILHRLELP